MDEEFKFSSHTKAVYFQCIYSTLTIRCASTYVSRPHNKVLENSEFRVPCRINNPSADRSLISPNYYVITRLPSFIQIHLYKSTPHIAFSQARAHNPHAHCSLAGSGPCRRYVCQTTLFDLRMYLFGVSSISVSPCRNIYRILPIIPNFRGTLLKKICSSTCSNSNLGRTIHISFSGIAQDVPFVYRPMQQSVHNLKNSCTYCIHNVHVINTESAPAVNFAYFFFSRKDRGSNFEF